MVAKHRKQASRIKSPQLYQLSYRPKSTDSQEKPAEPTDAREAVVPSVYPDNASKFKPGDAVVVTAGLAAGQRGTIFGKARVTFGDIPVWCVELPLPEGTRSIREDFLALEVA